MIDIKGEKYVCRSREREREIFIYDLIKGYGRHSFSTKMGEHDNQSNGL